jgi:hypothetical protein
MEEARGILKAALRRKPAPRLNLALSIRRHIAPLGGVVLPMEKREPVSRPLSARETPPADLRELPLPGTQGGAQSRNSTP